MGFGRVTDKKTEIAKFKSFCVASKTAKLKQGKVGRTEETKLIDALVRNGKRRGLDSKDVASVITEICFTGLDAASTAFYVNQSIETVYSKPPVAEPVMEVETTSTKKCNYMHSSEFVYVSLPKSFTVRETFGAQFEKLDDRHFLNEITIKRSYNKVTPGLDIVVGFFVRDTDRGPDYSKPLDITVSSNEITGDFDFLVTVNKMLEAAKRKMVESMQQIKAAELAAQAVIEDDEDEE